MNEREIKVIKKVDYVEPKEVSVQREIRAEITILEVYVFRYLKQAKRFVKKAEMQEA